MNSFKCRGITLCHLIVVSALGALLYSNSLTGSFQFDDKLNIVNNPLIRDIWNLWPPEGARWFGLLTFSLNYASGGLNPLGYHLVNTGIHIFASLAVYLFTLLTFETPCFDDQKETVIPAAWIAFACSLVFVAHPIQTQAVTYIVQRFSSLAALLFMLSLDCYILARLISINRLSWPTAGRPRPKLAAILLYAAALAAALISFKTKENAYTLPVVVLLYETMFFTCWTKLVTIFRKRQFIAATGLALAFLVYVLATQDLAGLFDKFKATNEITRHDYLITQFRVIITYIRLLFFPVNQTIDHHYQVYHSILEPAACSSLAAILLLLFLAVYLFRISSRAGFCLRVASFGILWFFVTLSVESSIIPIADVMFEHRLYLPSIGAILAVTASIVHVLQLMKPGISRSGKAAACILLVTTVTLSYATYLRNRVWKNELTLWADAIAKKPLNPRGYNMIGNYYQANFRIYDAIGYYKKALDVDSSYAVARSNLGNAYVLTGRIDEGLNELTRAARANRFDAIDAGILFYNIGKAFHLKGMPDRAIENLNIAVRYNPKEAAVYYLLGEIYQRKNMADQSLMYLKKAHDLDPSRY